MRKHILIGVTIDDSLQFIKGLPDLLIDNGWEVTIVSGPGRRIDRYKKESKFDTYVIKMDRNPNPIRDLIALWNWIIVLRKKKPDLVYLGTPKASLLGLLASRILRIPNRIYVLRGLRLETASGLSRKILISLEKICMRLATEIQVVSFSLKAEAIRLRLVNENKVFVVGNGSSNGVDIAHFGEFKLTEDKKRELEDSFGINPSKTVIGYVGRLTLDKGIYELVDAVQLLQQRGHQIQLVLVGKFDSNKDNQIRQHVNLSGIDCVFTGYSKDTRKFYRLMDIFCLPSHREGFPNASLEAAACGLPIVSSNSTGAIDSVIDDRTGFHFQAGNVEDLTSKLEILVKNEELRFVMGKNAYLWAKENFDRKKYQITMLRFFENKIEV